MSAHEDDDRQLQVAIAVVALLRVEVLGLAVELADLLLETFDVAHVLLKLGGILADYLALLVEPLEEVLLKDVELQFRLRFQDLEDHNRVENLFLRVFVEANLPEGLLDVLAVFVRVQVPEVSQCLHPEISGDAWVVVRLVLVLIANLEHVVLLVLLNVVVQ